MEMAETCERFFSLCLTQRGRFGPVPVLLEWHTIMTGLIWLSQLYERLDFGILSRREENLVLFIYGKS